MRPRGPDGMRAWRKRSAWWPNDIRSGAIDSPGLPPKPWVAGECQTGVSGMVPCGLQVPRRKPRKKVVTGATLQPTATQKNDVWSWDFVHDATTRGAAFRCLTVKDEATCFCLAIEVERSFSHQQVLAVLKRLVRHYGPPCYIRNDNGPELRAQALLTFYERHGIIPSRIRPGKPWQNGSNESFNGTFRRECLDVELFRHLTEAQEVIEVWRHRYNQERPHSTLGIRCQPGSTGRQQGKDPVPK